MAFRDFVKGNAWAILTGAVMLISNYTIVSYRLELLEKKVSEHEQQLHALSTVQTMAYQLQVIENELKLVRNDIDKYEQSMAEFYKNDWIKVERILATMGATSYIQKPEHLAKKVN